MLGFMWMHLFNTFLHYYFQFGSTGAKYLGNVLENNKVLEHLVLNNCNLGDAGLHPIADGMYKPVCRIA